MDIISRIIKAYLAKLFDGLHVTKSIKGLLINLNVSLVSNVLYTLQLRHGTFGLRTRMSHMSDTSADM